MTTNRRFSDHSIQSDNKNFVPFFFRQFILDLNNFTKEIMKIYQSIILNLLTTSLIDCCIPTQQVETTTTPSESKSEVCQFCPRIYNIKPFDDGAGGYSLSEESSNVRYVRSGTNPHICRLSLSCPSPSSYPWVDSTPIIIIDDTKFTCVDEAGEGKWIEKGATVDAVWCAVSIFNP